MAVKGVSVWLRDRAWAAGPHAYAALNYARRHLSAIFVVIGIALLGYVGFQYGDMYASQKHLEQAWKDQQTAPAAKSVGAGDQSADDGLTRLVIPKINLDAVVVDGTSYKQLA